MSSTVGQYFIRLIDKTQQLLSETTVCCLKCQQHGIIKRFNPQKEDLMVDHLLEFHAIVCNPPSDYILGSQLLANSSAVETGNDTVAVEIDNEQIQFMEDDVVEVEFVQQCSDGEDIMQDTDDPVEHVQTVRHSGVWNYFEVHPEEQKMYCIICRQSNVVHSYSTNSSTSNLRKHLKIAHDITVENYKPTKKERKEGSKKGSGVSPVWKYFCKITKDGVILERDYVYCGKCLENGTHHRYKQTSSTGTLKAHLKAIHSIDLNVKQDDEPVDIGVEASQCHMITSSAVRKSKRMSSARPYFQPATDDDDYVVCSLCMSENRIHKYRKSTSTTTLKVHLLQKHNIDPDNEENILSQVKEETNEMLKNEDIEEITETVVSFDPEVVEFAKRLISVKTRKIRTYFFKLDGEEDVCCAFCVTFGIKKAYKPTTSTTGLRRHLIGVHHTDPMEFFQNNSNTEPALSEEQIAESIAGLNKAKESDVWIYFSRKPIKPDDDDSPLDEDHIYCLLCWNAPVREIHKYRNTTSSGALKRHLASRHGMVIENTRHRILTSKLKKEEEGVQGESEVHVENDKNLQEEILETFMEPPEALPKPKLEKYCRACGKRDAGFFTKLSAPFEDADDDDDENNAQVNDPLKLSDLYFEITGIQVTENDKLSQLICYLCEANLKFSYKFRKIAIETEVSMLQKLNTPQNYEFEELEMLDEVQAESSLPQVLKCVKRKMPNISESDSDHNEQPIEKRRFMSQFIKPRVKRSQAPKNNTPENDYLVYLEDTEESKSIENYEEAQSMNENTQYEVLWDAQTVQNNSRSNSVIEYVDYASQMEENAEVQSDLEENTANIKKFVIIDPLSNSENSQSEEISDKKVKVEEPDKNEEKYKNYNFYICN